jgi:hypothetical protein
MSGAPERDSTGTLVDQTPTPVETTTPPPTTTETTPPTETAPAKPEAAPSLLNAEAKAEVPAKYEAWTVPEGYTLDTGVNDAAGTLFKELGLSQAQGQKLVDFYSEHAIKSNDALMDMVRQQNEAWQTEAKAHPDLKGKLEAGGPVLTTISRALDALGDPQLKADFRATMDMTGAGNHQAFIRAFYKMASKIVEGTHVAGNGPSPLGQTAPGQRPPSAAQAMYPNLPSSRG